MRRCSSESSRVQRRAANWCRLLSHSYAQVASASSKASFRSCSPTGLSFRRAPRCPPRKERSCCSSLRSLRNAYQRARRVHNVHLYTTHILVHIQIIRNRGTIERFETNSKFVQNSSGKWLYSIWGSFCDHLATMPLAAWISTTAPSQRQSSRCCSLMNKCLNNGIVD